MGAVFGLNYGWEHPLYFDKDVPDSAGFTRQPWFDSVGREAKMLRQSVGIIDISNFAKYRCKGAGAEDWLNAVFANRTPRDVGRSCLTPLIGVNGGIAGDFTVTRMAKDEFWVVGSGMAERYHQRFWAIVPLPKGTTFESMTDAWCGFNIAGPASCKALQTLINTSLETADFAFMRSKWLDVAGGSVSGVAGVVRGGSGLGNPLQCRRPSHCLQSTS